MYAQLHFIYLKADKSLLMPVFLRLKSPHPTSLQLPGASCYLRLLLEYIKTQPHEVTILSAWAAAGVGVGVGVGDQRFYLTTM